MFSYLWEKQDGGQSQTFWSVSPILSCGALRSCSRSANGRAEFLKNLKQSPSPTRYKTFYFAHSLLLSLSFFVSHFILFISLSLSLSRSALSPFLLSTLPLYLCPVWPDWAIYWTLGNFLKPLAVINFLVKSFLGDFYSHLAIFFWSHCLCRYVPFFPIYFLTQISRFFPI